MTDDEDKEPMMAVLDEALDCLYRSGYFEFCVGAWVNEVGENIDWASEEEPDGYKVTIYLSREPCQLCINGVEH